MNRHSIPDALFSALAYGGGGSAAAEPLRKAQASKRLLLLRGIHDAAVAGGHAQAPDVRRAYDRLAEIEKHAPAAVAAVLHHPGTGPWAQDSYAALLAGREADLGRFTAMAAAAAIRAAVPYEMGVPVRDGAVLVPSLGRALVPGEERVVVRCAGAVGPVRLPADVHDDAPGWEAVRTVRAGGSLLLLDEVDPGRLPKADVTTARMTGAGLRRWRGLFREASEVLARRHRTVASEVATLVTTVTPLELDPHGQSVSATSPKAFGAVGMSTPADARRLAVTLAHETQHIKLAALAELVPLTVPDDGRRYYAPWRDDPRPASGLLHGVYAHLGVAGFWRREREALTGAAALQAHTDYARWRDAALLAAGTLLDSDSLTAPGRVFVGALAGTLRDWSAERVPAEAASRARSAAESHRTRLRS